jgi:hypothetical protein
MTSRSQPGPGKSSSVIKWHRKVILLNLKSGFDETSCLKSSSRDKQFKLVESLNCPGPISHLPGTENSQKSLKLLKKVLSSSCEIVSLNILTKLTETLVFNSDGMSVVTPFKWLDNTFKQKFGFQSITICLLQYFTLDTNIKYASTEDQSRVASVTGGHSA